MERIMRLGGTYPVGLLRYALVMRLWMNLRKEINMRIISFLQQTYAEKPNTHADHGHNEEEGHHDHHHGHHDHGGHDKDGEPDQQHLDFDAGSNVNDPKIWFAATGAIFAIALCGVFGVLIIPLMQQVFYQHLIQVWFIKAILKVDRW